MRFALFLITAFATAGDFTTSLGDQYPYTISAITTDSAGNTYVVGSRVLQTVNFITSVVARSDVFVSKLDPSGNLLFTDTFGGTRIDTGKAITLDPFGNIYIAGIATSNDFPLSNGLQTQPNAYGTGFIVKLANDGARVLYSTYFGGTLGETTVSSLATDAMGNLYLTGSSSAADFPTTPGMPSGRLNCCSGTVTGAIVTKISATGDKILYSGVIVATAGSPISGIGIALDAAGNAYIAGQAYTFNLPTTTGAFSPHGYGAFVAKVGSSGAGLSYLTYVGPMQTQYVPVNGPSTTVSGIAADASGNVYLAGTTNDPSFQTTQGSYQPAFAPPETSFPGGDIVQLRDAFLAKLNPSGSAFVWSTFLNTYGLDSSQSITLDANGNVWATGNGGYKFPNTNGWTSGSEFVVELNAAGTALPFSALYPSGTAAQAIAVDPSGLVHIAGSSGFVSVAKTSPPSLQVGYFSNVFGGNATARISPAEVISIYGPGIGPATPVTASPTGGVYPTTLGGVQVTINGVNAPLLYVSANQINAVVPMAIATNSAATVRVINQSAVSPGFPVWIDPSAPQALPIVLNQDGTINSTSHPARSGSTITVYATGWQPTFAGLADGQVATAAADYCAGACTVSDLSSKIDPPLSLEVTYGGDAPGIVAGVTQFNVLLGSASGPAFGPTLAITAPGGARVLLGLWFQP